MGRERKPFKQAYADLRESAKHGPQRTKVRTESSATSTAPPPKKPTSGRRR